MSHHVLIIGAGICGLATALGLSQQGLKISIAEQAEKFEEIGAGLQLSPNAISALRFLNAYDEVLNTATIIDTMSIYDGKDLLTTLNMNVLAQRYDAPFLSLHRASLHSALLNCVQKQPNIALYPAHKLKNISIIDDSVQAEFDNGIVLNAIALIGADGVKSTTRQMLFNIPAQSTGLTAKRALIENATPHLTPQNSVEVFLAARSHGITYPLTHHNKRNYVWTVKNENIGEAPNGADTQNWLQWPIFTVPPLLKWSKGNILLIGDAAHGMPPFAAQGACMALEDAAALAKLCMNLPENAPIEPIFIQFEQIRMPRTTAIQTLSFKNGEVYHTTALKAWARNLVLKYFGAPLIAMRMSWVWRWKI